MLVIISDLHLGDGTPATSIPASAFYLFASRLRQDAVAGNQIYFNSGTWHTYFDLARKEPAERKFIPYKALTQITCYKPHEHNNRNFETWSGAYA